MSNEKPLGHFGAKFERAEKEITLPSGRKAVILETTYEEEKILSKLLPSDPATAIIRYLTRVVKTLDGKGDLATSDFDDLLMMDRTAILLNVRVLSHGPIHSFKFDCDDCENGKEQENEVDVQKIIDEIKPYKNGSRKEFSVTLDGHELFFELPDGRVERRVAQFKEPDVNKKIGAMSLWEETSKGKIPVRAQDLRSRHLSLIRKALNELEASIDTVAKLKCRECGSVTRSDLVGDPNFLFPHMT